MNSLTTKEFKEVIFDFDKSKAWKDSLRYNGSKPCIFIMGTTWCQPCKIVTPVLEDLEKDGNFNLYKIDVDEEYEISEFFNIRSVPTILFVPLKGQPIVHTGSFPKSEIKKLIIKYFGD